MDTPLLEALLRDRGASRAWTRILHEGGEVATTEVNLLELAQLALRGPRRGLPARLAALEAVRRSLTILPLDAEATRRALALYLHSKGGGRTRARGVSGSEPTLIAAICLSRGVSELLTDRRRAFPTGLAGLRIVRV